MRIVVRTDVDWRAMDGDAFHAQGERTRPLPFIRSKRAARALELWDRVFALDFYSYRAELQELAHATFAAAGADEVTIGIDGFDGGFEAWWSHPADEVVVPIDDDDWLFGGLSQLGEHFTDGVDVALWLVSSLSHDPRARAMAWQVLMVPCALSTNFAVRKSFLKEAFTPEAAKLVLAHHDRANERIADVLGLHGPPVHGKFRSLEHPRAAYVPRYFSLKHGHVGSIQFLVRAMNRDDPEAFLRGIDLRVPRPVPDHLAGLEPMCDALEELWARLGAGDAARSRPTTA